MPEPRIQKIQTHTTTVFESIILTDVVNEALNKLLYVFYTFRLSFGDPDPFYKGPFFINFLCGYFNYRKYVYDIQPH